MPRPQPPLTNQNAYTTWPGGVDPTTPLFNTDNQKFGGALRAPKGARRKSRKSRKSRKARKSRKSRKSRKASRRVRKNLRKVSRRVSKNVRKASRRAKKNTRKVVRRMKKNVRKNMNWMFGVKKGGAPVEGPAVCTPIDTTGSIASFPRLTSVCPEGSFQQTGRLVAE
jgi:hypothetical protein